MPKLNIHLLRERYSSLESVQLRPAKSGQPQHDEIAPTPPLPFPARLVIVPPEPRAPKWLKFLESSFGLGKANLNNQWASAILLLEVQHRVFAVAFGYGGNAIARGDLELDFGLRVLSNLLPADKLKTIETRTLDRNTRQSAIQMSADSDIQQFAINLDIDWVRKLGGRVSTGAIQGRVDGGDTVKLNWPGGPSTLGDLCAKLLEIASQDEGRTRFPFLDQLREVKPHDPVKVGLEAELGRMLERREPHLLALAPPEFEGVPAERIVFSAKRQSLEFDELSLTNFYTFLLGKSGVNPQDVYVEEHNEDAQVIRGDKVRQYLLAEVTHDGDVYILSGDRWFKIRGDHVKEVNDRVAALDDVTSALALPAWRADEDEGDYNERVAKERGFLPLDKRLVSFGRAKDKIEVADMLTPDRDFLCVKKMKDSATLSHLWGQACVSAEMINRDDAMLQKVASSFQSRFGKSFTRKDGRFVFAIGTARPGPLSGSLFFFAKVYLLKNVNSLQAMGYKVALCKIERPASIKSYAPRPRR